MHIPFWPISVQDVEDRGKLEEDLREACERASGAVGLFISMAQIIPSDEFKKLCYDKYIGFVRKEIPSMSHRVHKSYALILSITDIVMNF